MSKRGPGRSLHPVRAEPDHEIRHHIEERADLLIEQGWSRGLFRARPSRVRVLTKSSMLCHPAVLAPGW